MTSDTPRPSSPLFRLLVSFPIACFSGALVADIAYVASANMMWSDFADWLLAAGMALGVLAAIAGIGRVLANRRWLPRRPVLPLAIGSLIVLSLGFLDNLVHSRDAWTSVMPEGLALSAVTVVVILVTAWADTAAVNRVRMRYAGVMS